ncbi:MAG: hypothetical protein Q4D65_10225 [Peptostreptococcaceae bacterium]|nr:hypothetical protein [Peptostreptococcaceae bacterium]
MGRTMKDIAMRDIARKRNFFVMMFLCCILLSACNSKMKFEKSQDEFSTTYKNEHIEIQIANNVENPEEIFASMERDLNIINNFEPIEKLSIHINEKFLKGNDKSGVECNGEFVKTPEFKQLLISNAYGLYDNWKSVGIYGNLFADEMNTNVFCTNATNKITEQNKTKNEKQNTNQASNSANEERESKSEEQNQSTKYNTKNAERNNNQKVDFVSFYQNHDFSLFGAHFFPDFSSEEEIQNLTHASTSLVKYLLDNGKKEKLLKEEISIEDIKPWAKQNHINLTYLEELYNHINEIKVSSPSVFEKLYLDTRRDINGFSIRVASAEEEYDTATELEQVLVLFDEDIKNNLEVIRAQAPNFYKEYEKALTNVPKVNYIFNSKDNVNSQANYEIYLKVLDAQMVEYNHFLLRKSFEDNSVSLDRPQWIAEGLDIFLGQSYSAGWDMKIFLEGFLHNELETTHPDENVRRYLKGMREIFEKNIDAQNIDDWLAEEGNKNKAIHLLNASGLGFPEHNRLPFFNSDTVFVKKGPRTYHGIDEPNNLNFFAHVSFVTYMVEQFGLEKMLYLGVQDFDKITFEEYFGKSYKELEDDWKQYLIDNIENGEWLVYGDKGQK